MLRCTMRRRWCASTISTNITRPVSVGTVKKSIDAADASDSSGMSYTFEETDVGTVPAGATTCVPRRQHGAYGARHEFGVRPTAGSPSPCHGRERRSVDPEVDGRPVGVSNVGSIGGGASRDATGQRCPAGRPPTPCASSARLASRRSKTIDRHVRGAGGSRNVSSPSAAAEAPGSPRPIPDVRGAPTPVHGRRRGVAPAGIDRGWRRCEKSTGTSSGEGQGLD